MPTQVSPARAWAKRLAYLLIVMAAAGIASPTERFTRLQIGPLYSLEAILLAWFAAALVASAGRRFREFKVLWPAALFFSWGAALLCRDLFSNGDQIPDHRTMLRVLQHSLVFVYPILWMTVGTWLARTDRAVTALVILVVLLVNTLPCLLGQPIANLSLGPLTAVVLVVTLDKALSWPEKSAERLAYWILSLTLALLTFLPYWRFWFLELPLERTSLMVLLFMLVTTPLLRRKRLSSLRSLAITLPLFFVGFVLASALDQFFQPDSNSATHKPRMSISEHVADNFFGTPLRSGVAPGSLAPALGSIRRFWWTQAILDWKLAPITGIGLIPEVPSAIVEGVPNSWPSPETRKRFAIAAPLSGPHNSYLTILARLGLIGSALFALILLNWLWQIWPLVRGRELNLYEIMVIMLPVSGAIYAALNIGLETPRNSALMWLFAGSAFVYASSLAEAQAQATSRDA